MNDTTRAQIARINELSQIARTSWLGLLAFLAFVGVTLLGVQDADFFVPSRETVLPIVAVRIPTANFFWFAPLLTTALYINLHVHLLKLWDAIAEAPATVDGLALGDYVHMWLGNDLVLKMKGGGALRRRPMATLIHLVSGVLVWVAAPLVIAGFWWRSLPAHDQWLTLTIAACVGVTLYAGLTSWWYATNRLRRPWATPWSGWRVKALVLAGVAALAVAGWLATERDVTIDRTTPLIGPLMGDRAFSTLVPAHLSEVALVTLPPDWATPDTARLAFRRAWCAQELLPAEVCDRLPRTERPISAHTLALRRDWCAENLDPGADCVAAFVAFDARFREAWAEERAHARANLGRLNLAGRDLRGAVAAGTDLVGALLTGARLRGADFRGARMEGANLRAATLQGALLRGAQLQEAILTGANLEGADLRDARLERALLPDANLRGVDLGDARLEGAYLLNADLAGADLSPAGLEDADLTVADLTGTDLRNARLTRADLRGARLDGADLRWADLRAARWSGARTAASPAHFADFRGAADLTQAQLDGLVGNAATLLPDHPAPDTGAPYSIPSCWTAPPPDLDGLVARMSENLITSPAALRDSLVCAPGDAPIPTGTPCPLDTSREQCLAPPP